MTVFFFTNKQSNLIQFRSAHKYTLLTEVEIHLGNVFWSTISFTIEIHSLNLLLITQLETVDDGKINLNVLVDEVNRKLITGSGGLWNELNLGTFFIANDFLLISKKDFKTRKKMKFCCLFVITKTSISLTLALNALHCPHSLKCST